MRIGKNENELYMTALYIRLSKEDGGRQNPNTIENQKALLENYVNGQPDMQVYDTYVDNGYSGVDFRRPAFQRLMEDIKKGRVSCVLVKDLSRLGRNYLETGSYLEQVFPFYHIRFIAVTDQFDTLYEPDFDSGISISIPLKNIVNEAYARDISRKVCSAVSMRQREGRYGGGAAPYGYQKSKAAGGKYEIDEEAADIVRSIFQLRAQNYDCESIVQMLNENGIKSPNAYRFEKGILKDQRMRDIPWKTCTVENLLRDEVYLGSMVRGKTRKALYKGKKRQRVPRSEWIVIPGMHEPIVSKKLFDKAGEYRRNRDETI